MGLGSLPRWTRGWWKVVRVSFYFFCVFVILSALAARALYAQAKHAARALGHELAGVSDLTARAESLVVNGARFHHAALTVKDSVSGVLDAVETHCQQSTGAFTRGMRELERTHADVLDKYPVGSIRRGVFREESNEGGMLVCFVDQGQSGLSDLARAVESFVRTSDLSAFGNVRYVTAERIPDGRTRVMLLWTDAELSISKMFPATGDAAGSDSTVLPRPPNARRTLSATADGMSYGLRSYESRDGRDSVGAFYDRWMSQNGWKASARDQPSGSASYLHRDGRQAFVTVSAARGRTYVTVIEAGRANATSIASTGMLE
jgi:hypothetical protein